ncbi:MAG: non-heme iron oxygenase ferredoxin subunit [Caulobacteraceae bacterium]|nr:non-heme iron oxygenase ferredoxin subunit [Caulobacteraceae bacterium]
MKLRLCSRGDLPTCEVRRFELADGRAVALYHLEDGFFATDDLCTHGEASLADGEIEDGRIVCPYHLGAFDIRTGKATDAPCHIPLKTYPVVEIDGELFVEGEKVEG